MIEEADKYKAEDSKFLEKVKAMNALDDYVYKMWKALKDKDINSKLRQLLMLEICLMLMVITSHKMCLRII